jgi:hypothetical protein
MCSRVIRFRLNRRISQQHNRSLSTVIFFEDNSPTLNYLY